MPERVHDLLEKAARARRLTSATDDPWTIRELKSFASECEAEAETLRGSAREIIPLPARPIRR